MSNGIVNEFYTLPGEIRSFDLPGAGTLKFLIILCCLLFCLLIRRSIYLIYGNFVVTIPHPISADEIRSRFSCEMSDMYRDEVPKYGALLDIVSKVNTGVLDRNPALHKALDSANELARLDVERHGAIRLGKPEELHTMRRIFYVMGMHPVGYYDLSVAGVPVHATAFRPITDEALNRNPFRVFTSLLRLELIEDEALREKAAAILERRQIFSDRVLHLLDKYESEGGLSGQDAHIFVSEVKEIFRWHQDATVSQEIYKQLHDSHRLIADVVCFKGPHINHLTPRTLDIDEVQEQMGQLGLNPKEVIEGPPRRQCPILLRQTSFKALEEKIRFADDEQAGTHTARFGEIEQRGVALTAKGRALYDQLLDQARSYNNEGNAGDGYARRLAESFKAFPDDVETLRKEQLAYFRYVLNDAALFNAKAGSDGVRDLDVLISTGAVAVEPIVYEDFLPVSAAGIFQSNLGGAEQKHYAANASRLQFEKDLGIAVLDELMLYEAAQAKSIEVLFSTLETVVA
ncbi:VOC family protein [Advenella sp. WQ 585]|uniref:2-oxoadipate dioxygenase/decarboxylase n=1 Tax=Advenella mandrilli TaxID=2800330 RepID=A0ABS1EDN6_9BURK|nr:VOC family protein [Advenella mandrilli]NLY34616.1 VOC family protein [Alcaligenaceae bacterium]